MRSSKQQVFPISSQLYSMIDKSSPDEYPEAIKNWCNYVDWINMDFLFFPINEDNHWSLMVAMNPGKVIETLSSSSIEDEQTIFVHFDSCSSGGHSSIRIVFNIICFLSLHCKRLDDFGSLCSTIDKEDMHNKIVSIAMKPKGKWLHQYCVMFIIFYENLIFTNYNISFNSKR